MKKVKIIFGIILTFIVFSCSSAWAIEETKDSEAINLYNDGVLEAKQGNYEKSIDLFKKALKDYPDFIDAYYNLGSIYAQTGDFQNAISTFQSLLKYSPKDFDAKYKLAEIYTAMQKTDVALRYLSDIPEYSEKYSDAMILKAHILNPEIEEKPSFSASNIYDSENEVVQTRNGYETTITDTMPANGKIIVNKYLSPTGIAVDKAGNMYVASFAENTIYKINQRGQNRVFTQSPMIDGPIGIACDSAGNLYIANYNHNNILKVTPSGNVSIALNEVERPYFLHVKDGMLYISEQGSNVLVKYPI